MATEISKDEYVEQLHEEIHELKRILGMVWAGVSDKKRAEIEKFQADAWTMIPVLYGTLAKIKAKL